MRFKIFIFYVLAIILLAGCNINEDNMNDNYEYQGKDLGLTIEGDEAIFTLWSPEAEAVRINIYAHYDDTTPTFVHALNQGKDGVWSVKVEKVMGYYYSFQTQYDGMWLHETPGIYAKAVSVNGERGYICDVNSIVPTGWESDKMNLPPIKQKEIILYELHIRDVSIAPTSGITHKGKFLGLAEHGTTTKSGTSTGLDYFTSLGVTHVHLLPSFDYKSIDERLLDTPQYNWGYDPQNYNAPEGSYATDATDPTVRILEMKEMIMAFHNAGIRVVMDVVYNHTGGANELSCFNLEVPNYYYRLNEDNSWSNASGCGNETASEKFMMRKYIIESLLYWQKEYHIDGFRFDLMGIHDIETMNQISEELHKQNPDIILYGEGWTAGDSPLPYEERALKAYAYQLDNIAVFSDDIRDAIKGHYSDHHDQGFVSGKALLEESIKFGIVGATHHPQINYKKVNYSDTIWALNPTQCINYVSCHDNHTLWDKLSISSPEASENELKKMQRLAGAIILTSQGIPFLHAGVEMCRTKQGVENSYESPDSINQFDWERVEQNIEMVHYFKDLITLRKEHPAFSLGTTKLIQKHLHFLPEQANVVAYTLINAPNDNWKNIVVIFNGNNHEITATVPEGDYKVVLSGDKINQQGISSFTGDNVIVGSREALIAIKQ